MSVTFAVAIFAVLWWIVLFAVLPWGVRSQDDDEDVVPGSASSAPSNPMLWRKVAATTGITAVLWLAIVAVIVNPPAVLIDYLGLSEMPPWIADPGAPPPGTTEPGPAPR